MKPAELSRPPSAPGAFAPDWAEPELRALAQLTHDLMVVVNADGRFLWANEAFLQRLGWTRDQLQAKAIEKLVHPEDLAAARNAIAALVTGQLDEVRDLEARVRQSNGGYRWLVWRGRRGSQPDRLIGIAQDVSDLKHAHQEMLRKDNIFRTIVENAPVSIRVVQNGKSVFHNRGFERIFGFASREDALAAPVGGQVAPEYKEAHRAYRESVLHGDPAPESLEYEAIRADGKRIWLNTMAQRIEWEGRPAIQHVGVEITRRKKLESDLQQVQKLDAIGALAGGVAHDFNNILAVVLGTSEMLLDRQLTDNALRDDIQSVREAAMRGAGLTRQLLAFSRRSVLRLEIVDLGRVLADMEKMLRRVIGENIDLITHAAPDVHRVKADISQLEQVILNLAVNARDAMPHGGRLTIESGNAILDAEYAAEHADAVPGDYVCLSVSDTGAGMDAETRRRIFEPFFTTKSKGKGTGLGLSTVYGIVKQLGGNIWVYSELGLGTTFKVYLPRSDTLDVSDVDPFADDRADSGTESVLLVEDDQDVRGVVTRNLKYAGYSVFAAASGAEALELLTAHQGPLDLVITDVIMPGMSGREMVRRLQPRFAQLPVLYISGYTDDMISHHGLLEPGIQLLEKPFTREDLLRRVRELLHAAGGGNGGPPAR